MPRPSNAPVLAARLPALVVGALLALIAAAPPDALAHAGGDRRETRVAGVCGRGAAAKLKLKADDGAIEAEFEVQHNRPRTSWRVTIVQEHRVVWRSVVRTRARRGSFAVERRLRDMSGADHVVARAVGPRGVTCQAAGVLW